MTVNISLLGCLSLGNDSPVTSIFTGDRGLGEVQHLPDSVHIVSITATENIQSPLGEKLLIILKKEKHKRKISLLPFKKV